MFLWFYSYLLKNFSGKVLVNHFVYMGIAGFTSVNISTLISGFFRSCDNQTE